ncbi:M48 family metallopeptidase [Actinoplanes lobatus]|uniref:Zn-dependent protease with chaperone function n=1 Tax=Actinoplanes lobatus TaxID=113568 RepID=A0A7W7HD51_9ACTN|nr:M48 family metallopeptidase [Actinoplanes lobatus]MBB4748345.1 Zn-dependent protease with chaperone function [Actinoplanes lobatus]
MSITTADVCPLCAGALTTLPEQEPWCGACEWNLDAFPPVEDAGWYSRRIIERDRRAGFRAHRELATSEPDENGGRTAYRILLLISGLLVLGNLGLAGYGLYLVIWGDPLFPKMFGLMLAGLAWVFRPRIGSFKRFLSEDTYLVERTDAPVLHRLIELVAAEIGAPVPDRLMIDYAGNASVAVVGFRRTSVLTLGLPLLVALRPQELVALIGHELGHLKHEDSARALLIQPATTTFGRLAEMVRPPAEEDVVGAGDPAIVVYRLWQAVGGTLALLLSAAHIRIGVVAADGNRRVELRADAMAARAAGSEAALSILDALTQMGMFFEHIQPWVPKGEAGPAWRRLIHAVREREQPDGPARLQLTARTGATLLASHPPAGRRHQWLAARPPQPAHLVVDPATAARLDREIDRYAEALHRAMIDHPMFWNG